MTQVELPQVSLQRYADLLKRRRWQVIPVSLFGLLVGGLVAFFIPRYYVADVLMEHQQVPGEVATNVEDPFRSIVESAQITIPLAVGDTMRKLLWEEGLVADAYERSQNERAVRSRLRVVDSNQERGRPYAQIRVFFRDLDGMRAAMFLNTLIETWIQKRLDDLRAPAEERQRQATTEANAHLTAHEGLNDQMRALERQYGIQPNLPIDAQVREAEERAAKLMTTREEMKAKDARRKVLRALLAVDQDKLAGLVPRVKPGPELLVAAAKNNPEVLKAFLSIKYYRDSMETYEETSKYYADAKRQAEKNEAKLRELLGTGTDPDGLVPNPEHAAMVATITASETELKLLDDAIALLQRELDEEQQRVEGLNRIWSTYERLVRNVKEAATNRELALGKLREATDLIAKLTNQQTVKIVERASPPPRPTEPNILVVALIGCVLGLGFAISLILLLDLLQASFKTVDDVERGLAVPVLGGMSHLETEEERQQSIRSRRRVTVTAAAFLVVCVALVLLFYADPTRLPPVLRDLLALLLGA